MNNEEKILVDKNGKPVNTITQSVCVIWLMADFISHCDRLYPDKDEAFANIKEMAENIKNEARSLEERLTN